MTRKLHPIAAQRIRKLGDDHGIILDAVDDFHHVLEIDRLAREIAGENQSPEWRAAMDPVRKVGNVTLYRLSLGAEAFLYETVMPWFEHVGESGERIKNLSLAYAMAHARTPDVFWSPDRAEWIKTVTRWARRVNVDYVCLLDALNEFLDGEDTSDPHARKKTDADDTKPVDHSWLIELLTREYSKEPDFWLWGTPAVQARMLVKEYTELKEIEARSNSKTARAPNPDSRSIRALVALRTYVAEIVAEKGGGDV